MKETLNEKMPKKASLTILTLHNRNFTFIDRETNDILYFKKRQPYDSF